MPPQPRTRVRKPTPAAAKRPPPIFDFAEFLTSTGLAPRVREHPENALIYSQGDRAGDVFYIQAGAIKLSVVSPRGKEAVVGILMKGDFFGEGCLAGQPLRMASAVAMNATTVVAVRKAKMADLLRTEPDLATRLLAHLLARNIRIEADLADQLFNSSEKRLARALLLLTRYGKADQLEELPKISQDTLADMVGTTRSRINVFMNKFRKMGFIDYNGHIRVYDSLITVLLHD